MYIDSKIKGERKLYYQNGQLWKICMFIDGKKNGENLSYYENGRGLSKDNHMRENLLKTNFPGQLRRSCTYINGKKNGEYLRANYYIYIKIEILNT
jgi:antitoxin component YwqK of YwqJK toxin-antitoxin module